MMNDELEKFCEWFDSIIEPNGTINLDKHPEFINFVQNVFGLKRMNFKDLEKIDNLGNTINFELEKRVIDE